MNHIRKFQSFRKGKKREEIIKEAVFQVNDIYKVKTTIDIPQSLINAYVKKVKDNTGKNLRQFFGDMDIAEEIVKFVAQSGLDADTLSATALVGGAQGQAQGQGQSQPQAQTQMEAQPQAQPQAQGQVQVQTQGQEQGQDDFEEVQGQGQTQPQTQPQAQPQAQGQGQAQAQEEEEGEEELPA